MKRLNLTFLAFAVFCGIGIPALLGHSPARPGLVLIGTIFFWALFFAYAYWKGQQIRKIVPQPDTWTPVQRRLALKKVESELKSLRGMRRCPGYVLLFLLFGVAVTGAAIFVFPRLPASANELAFLQAWGMVFGLAYVVLTALFTFTWWTGGWERYIDAYILKAEKLQAQILLLPH